MQEIIAHIFKALGGPTRIAEGTGFPVQTVHSWINKQPADIPPWRRADVLSFAQRAKLFDALSDEAKAYLTSTERAARKAAA